MNIASKPNCPSPCAEWLVATLCVALGTCAAAGPLPEPGFPQGIGMQLKPDSFNVATLDAAYALGVRVVRRGFYWSSVEKEKGTYSFADYEVPMAHAKELGLTVVGCLFSGNKLYEDHGRGGVLTEEGRQGFAAFAAATAAHFRGQPVIWEVWNEPNVRTFWRKDGTHNTVEFADEYTALVKAVVPAMLKADPDCFVVAGSVSNYWEPSYQWTEFCFQKGILNSGIRGWSVHPYGVKTPEEHAVGHARTRALLVKYGAPELPMLNTERGYSVKETAEGWSGGTKEQARVYQGWHFVRQLLVDQLNGVRPSVWYEWGGEEFGVADADGPRPLQAACRKLVAELGGYAVVQRLESDSARDYLVLCTNAVGARKLVAWTSPAPGGSPDEIVPHDVAVGLGEGREALKLALTGEPQYAVVPAGATPGKSVTTSVAAPVAAPVVETPAGAADLKLFEPGAQWKFVKNTGDGSFALATDTDGKPLGVLSYDFSGSKSQGRPYVLASTALAVADGATALLLQVRTPIAQPLTFRVTDATGQTLQYKTRAKGTGQWEPVRIPLDKKLEHWEGANDGKTHFPLKSLVFSVPQPGDDAKVGKVEYSAVAAVGGTAPAAPAPAAPAPAATAPAATPAAPRAEGAAAPSVGSLKLFEAGKAWRFEKNTGEGSFTVGKDADGKDVGTMAFDFTQTKTDKTPYVLASAPINVPAGCAAVTLNVRTAQPQPLTFRVKDSTGQTLQFKARAKGTGQWEPVRIPLDKKLEHWDGANDGLPHFPLASITFSVPRPNAETLTGKVEYAEATAE